MSLCINPNCPKPENSDNWLFCPACGSELLLEGRYRVTRQLGADGFGKTYEVSDRTGVSKVLKLLANDDAKNVELFQREAEVLSRLNHPGIPQVEPEGYFTEFTDTQREFAAITSVQHDTNYYTDTRKKNLCHPCIRVKNPCWASSTWYKLLR